MWPFVLLVLLADWCQAGEVLLGPAERAPRLLAAQLMGSAGTRTQAQF